MGRGQGNLSGVSAQRRPIEQTAIALRGPVRAGTAAAMRRLKTQLDKYGVTLGITESPLPNRGLLGRQRWSQVLVEVKGTAEQIQIASKIIMRAVNKWNSDNDYDIELPEIFG